MNDRDNALQQNFEAVERGTPVNQVLAGLTGEDAELAPLIQLAVSMHGTAHPQVNPARATEDKHKMYAQAKTKLAGRNWFSVPKLLVFAGITAALVLLLVALLARPAGSAAQLANVSGLVEVTSSETAEDWRIASTGDTLQAGQRLRTYDDSSVILVFAEGSRALVGAGTDVTLTTLQAERGGVIHVDMLQRSGKTTHRVTPFNGKDSSYLVRTPDGDAQVHGTVFDVAVRQPGRSLFSVISGKVQVNHAGAQIFLLPGQATVAGEQVGLEEAAYTFDLTGTLQAMDGESWTVDGAKITVDAQTQVTGTPALNAQVRVTGRVLADGVWLADSVVVLNESEPTPAVMTYTGILSSMEGDTWQIGSKSVLVNSATLRDPDLKVGDTVKVTFRVLEDGAWLAVSVERLGEEEPAPTETAIAPTLPVPASSLVFQPASAEVNACNAAEQSAAGVLVNTGADASNARLEVLVTEGAGYVDSATVSPERIDSIPAGGQAGFTVNVKLNSSWASAVNQTVTVRVLLSHASQGPVQANGQFDFTIHSDCNATATPTGTPQVTGTPDLTPSPEAPAASCTGADPHPTGLRLAAEFGVPYEEIMGWFCQNFGFGEIKQAYEMSRETGLPAADIFTMRRSGMGWGNIKKLMNQPNSQISGTPEPGNGNNKNKDQDNPGKGPNKPEKTKKPNPGKKK